MKYLGIILTSSTIVLVSLLFKYLHDRGKEKETKNNIIKQPHMFLYIGIVGCLFADVFIPILCFLELDPTMNWYESLLFSLIGIIPMNILCIYLLLLSINWQIIVYDDKAEYFNLFKRRKIFMFSEYSIKDYQSSVRILKYFKDKNNKKVSKCMVNISSYCTNTKQLVIKYKEYKQNLKKYN